MALGPQYCKQLREELRMHANFPPNRPIALGDYGVLRDHIFERLGNVSQLGVHLQTIPGAGRSTFQFKSKGGVDFQLIAKGEVEPGGVPAVRAALELKFSGENAVFFAAAGCTVDAVDDLLALQAAIVSLMGHCLRGPGQRDPAGSVEPGFSRHSSRRCRARPGSQAQPAHRPRDRHRRQPDSPLSTRPPAGYV